MDTREWIFVLGVIAVVIIVLILAARWRRQRFDDIRPGEHLGADANGGFSSNELPGGGARTVGYRDPSDIERMNDQIRERAEASKPRLSSFRPEPVVQPSLLDDEEDQDDDYDGDNYPDEQQEAVPLLLDPSDEHNPEGLEKSTVEAPQLEGAKQEQEGAQSQQSSVSKSEHLEELENLADDLKEPVPELELRAEKEDQPSRLTAKAEPKKEQKAPTKPEEPRPEEEPGEIIIINLMTEPAQPYEGAILLKLVSELGLRHGEMKIFHYCGRHGDEQPQFKMANLLKPGYFDINNMGRTRTHALCFFFELMPDQENMKIYESMLSVINKLKEDLGGELHDENRSVFTIQTSEHCRNRIRDFQRRHLLARQETSG